MTTSEKVIGIINFREGEISQGLKEVQQKIKQAEEAKDAQTKISFSGVDPLQSTREIIGTLDRYISTGIGYAVSVKFLRTYLETHPDLLKK